MVLNEMVLNQIFFELNLIELNLIEPNDIDLWDIVEREDEELGKDLSRKRWKSVGNSSGCVLSQ